MVKNKREELEEIFHPRSIAVVGASNNPDSSGFLYMDYLLQGGYPGRLYPINPRGEKILGIQSYPNLDDVPGEVDYVICCIAAESVPDMLRQCGRKGVKAAQLYTARLTETGQEKARELEQIIGEEAKRQGVRLIGPNCTGLFYPKERITTQYDFCMEPGSVGAACQSGGISWEFSRHAALRGVRFSKVIGYGNALDLNESDFLEYFAQDEETDLIALYIEGVREGRRFFRALRETSRIKPVIILKGGKTGAGRKRAFSSPAQR